MCFYWRFQKFNLPNNKGIAIVDYAHSPDAYENIFKRCGLDVIQVQADSGPIGGKDSSEFISIAYK